MLLTFNNKTNKITDIKYNPNINPLGGIPKNGILTSLERFGGTKDDYTSIQIHDEKYKDIVDMILKYPREFIIPNKDIEKIAVDFEGYNSYLKELEEREILESLIPSKEEVLRAETELQIITILQEVNLI